jgi:hypothetical protein
MKRILTLSLVIVSLLVQVVTAQQTYTHDQVDYTFELPSTMWRTIIEPDTTHEHPEFVYGDRLDGYLTIRKEIVEAGTCATRCRPETPISTRLRSGKRRAVQRTSRGRDSVV